MKASRRGPKATTRTARCAAGWHWVGVVEVLRWRRVGQNPPSHQKSLRRASHSATQRYS